MRRFTFESEMYETLPCLPMAVRHKLDLMAIKISQSQWLSLDLNERRLIREAAANTKQDLIEFSDLVPGSFGCALVMNPEHFHPSNNKPRRHRWNCPRILPPTLVHSGLS